MKAKYVGDPRYGGEGPRETELRGCCFPKGVFVSVPDDLGEKLKGNCHFVVEGGTADPFDHDDDGHPGGSRALSADDKEERAALLDEIEEITGKRPHPNTGLEKLRAALAKASGDEAGEPPLSKEVDSWLNAEDED